VGELRDIDLRGEVPPDRVVERLVGRQQAAGKRPGTGERLARALPEQRLESALPDLQDGCERRVLGSVSVCSRLGQKFPPLRLKLPERSIR